MQELYPDHATQLKTTDYSFFLITMAIMAISIENLFLFKFIGQPLDIAHNVSTLSRNNQRPPNNTQCPFFFCTWLTTPGRNRWLDIGQSFVKYVIVLLCDHLVFPDVTVVFLGG